jgi:hypothetical protein
MATSRGILPIAVAPEIIGRLLGERAFARPAGRAAP